MSFAMRSRDEYSSPDLKMASQRLSTLYHKMNFFVLTVIAIHSTFSYPLPCTVSNENKIMKDTNDRRNCSAVHEEEG